MKLDTNAHSTFRLYYHLIFVVKYRRQVFTDEISNRAKEIFSYIAPFYKIELVKWNHDKDHVHILFSEALIKVIKEYIENKGQKK